MFPLLLIAAAIGGWFFLSKKDTPQLPTAKPSGNGKPVSSTQQMFPTTPLNAPQKVMSQRISNQSPPIRQQQTEEQYQDNSQNSQSSSQTSSQPVYQQRSKSDPPPPPPSPVTAPTVAQAAQTAIAQTATQAANQAVQQVATQATTKAAEVIAATTPPMVPGTAIQALRPPPPPPPAPVARGPGKTPGSKSDPPPRSKSDPPPPMVAVARPTTITSLQQLGKNIGIRPPAPAPKPSTDKPIPGNPRFERKS